MAQNSTPITLQDAADLYDLSIQNMFVKSAGMDPMDYSKYYNVETGVEDYIVKDSSLSGLGEAAIVDPENAVIVGESPVQGNSQSYTQVEYGKVMSFTKRMWKFGIKKRDMVKITNELRMACVRKRERLCAERLDNMRNTSYTTTDDRGNYTVTTTGGDGVSFVSSAHTREDGGTNWNNRVYDGTNYDLVMDYPALKAILRTESLVTDPKGNLMQDLNYDRIVVAKGSNASFKLKEILGAIQKGWKPVSADHDGPGIDRKFEVLELSRLTNREYFYAFDSRMDKMFEYGLQYLESQAIELEGPNLVFKTGEIQYKATVMFSIGHNDSRNWAGSIAIPANS